ncbi:MAG: hypothetical protein Q9160_002241 [Pyrenula sp. 1 TL-2023]
MAAVSSSDNLSSLRSVFEALTTIHSDLPVLAEQTKSPPFEGISLLNTKNELLLAYIQDLILFMTLRLRDNLSSKTEPPNDTSNFTNEIGKRLTEIRVYTEKGVRPLEGRLKYQIDKVVKMAEDAENLNKHQATRLSERRKQKQSITKRNLGGADRSSQSDSSRDLRPISGSESSTSDSELDDLAFRPNPVSLNQKEAVNNSSATLQDASKGNFSGAYKPPRIQSARMPEPNDRAERQRRGPHKSALIDEYVTSELSTAPLMEPSVGSGNTIIDKGRSAMGRQEKFDEKERREYEETNFVRLPGESKAERRKRNRIERLHVDRQIYGGEDWSGLGGLSDRIARVTGGPRHSSGILDRNRKRSTTSEGYDLQTGSSMGEAFEKRRKVLEGRKARLGARNR